MAEDDRLTAVARATLDLDNAEAWTFVRTWVVQHIPSRRGWWFEATKLIWQERQRLRDGTPTDQQRLRATVVDPDAEIAERLAATLTETELTDLS